MLRRLSAYPKTLLVWLFLSVIIILAHLLLPPKMAEDLTAITLTIIATVYVGFALQDGRVGIMIIEITVAVIFVVFAVLGLWLNAYFWVVGLFLHGVWDWLHHPKAITTRVPSYYPPVCVLVDWLLAGFLLVKFYLMP